MMNNIVNLKAVHTLKEAAGLIQELSGGTSSFINQLYTVNLALLSPELLPKAVEAMLHYKILHQLTQDSLRDQIIQQSNKIGRYLTPEEVIEVIKIHSPETLRVCMK